MKPNIFDVATSELSQDAFLTWLFRWADQGAKSYNEKLNTCAKDFIKLLINKKINYNKEINVVSAGRQWKNIDIWAKINNEVLIVIEDKTSTFEHSDQLNRYKNFAEDWCKKNNYQLVLIYLKTGLEYGGNTKVIENKDYVKIERSDLISFFEKHSEVKNDIIEDFIDRNNNLDNKNNSYKSLPVHQWIDASWIGFYKMLEKHISVTGWKYVANQSGGFYGLWWNFIDWKENKVYQQIEQGDLCFKIEAKNNKANSRNEFYKILMHTAKLKNIPEIKKPKRFGTGTWMTVAIVKKENWLGKDDEVFDENIVVSNLKKYESFLKEVIK